MRLISILIIVSILAIVAVSCSLTVLILHADSIMIDAAKDIHPVAAQLTDSAKHFTDDADKFTSRFDRSLFIFDGTMNAMRHTLKNQDAYLIAASQQLVENEKRLATLLASADKLVNSVNDNQDRVSAALENDLLNLNGAIIDAQLAVKNGSKLIQDADGVVRDPHIPDILTNADLLTFHAQSSMASIDKVLIRWSKPSSFFKGLLKQLVPKPTIGVH